MKQRKNNGFSSETEAKILSIIQSCKTEEQLNQTYDLASFYGKLCDKFYEEAPLKEKFLRLFYSNSNPKHYEYLFKRKSNFRMHCFQIITAQLRKILSNKVLC